MIGKVSRGRDTAGLLRYLFGPGRANEHTNPHLVAAWDDTVLADNLAATPEGHPRVKDLAALMDQPLALLHRPSQKIEQQVEELGGRAGAGKPAATVWHCSLRTAPGDRRLSDAEWAVVTANVVAAAGLAPHGDEGGCRWVAVRHAEDHVHLAVTLARQDGRRPRTSHDFARVGAACRAAEVRLDLTRTPARDSTAPRRPTRAETEKATRLGVTVTDREHLRRRVRRAALASRNLPQFVRLLEQDGVTVRLRHSSVDAGEVTGYAVALSGAGPSRDGAIWFGGGRLAPQLSLPWLQSQWSRHSHERERPAVRLEQLISRRKLTGRAAALVGTAARAAANLERGDLVALATGVLRATAARAR